MGLRQDLRFAFRRLRSNRRVALYVVGVAAPSVGLLIAAYAVAYAVVLRPLAFGHSDALVVVRRVASDDGVALVSTPELADWQAQSLTLQSMAGVHAEEVDLQAAPPIRTSAAVVTWNAFDVLEIAPIVGRTFGPDDGRFGSEPVVVLTEGVWRRMYGADPSVIGRRVRIRSFDRQDDYRIIGVMADAARLYQLPVCAVYLPFAVDPAHPATRQSLQHLVIGRLRPNVTLNAAATEMSSIVRRLDGQGATNAAGVRAEIVPLERAELGDARRQLLVLGVSALLVLVMGWVNVSGLLLRDGAVRFEEFRIRYAIGASVVQRMRVLFTEYVVLGAMILIVGWGIATLGTPALVALAPSELPRIQDLRFGANVFAFAALSVALCVLVFGTAPAIVLATRPASRPNGIGGARAARLAQDGLLLVQLALVLGVLLTSTLLTRSFLNLLNTDPGFDSSNIVGAEVTLGEEYWSSPDRHAAFQQELLRRAARLPGVEQASLSFVLPPFPDGRMRAVVRSGRAEAPLFRVVDQGYFGLMRIPLVYGTDFPRAGRDRSLFVIVNSALAQRYYGRQNVTGEYLQLGPTRRQIIGVVGNVREQGLHKSAEPTLYLPFALPSPMPPHFWVLVRTPAWREEVGASLRQTVAEMDPNLSVTLSTLDARLSAERAASRFHAVIMTTFASLSAILCLSGVFVVVSQRFDERSKELAIRVALGASPTAVTWLIVGRLVRIIGAATALGWWVGVLLSESVGAALSGFSGNGGVVILIGTGCFYLVIAAATGIAIRRANLSDLSSALRSE